MTRKSAVVLLLLLVSLWLPASAFYLHVSLPDNVGGEMVLTLYGADNARSEMRCRIRQGECVFEGTVARATFAELSHPKADEPLLFFVEEADIRVNFNLSNPSLSPVMGSRANSLYRYQLEQWRGDADSIAAYVATHQRAPQAAFLIDHYLLKRGVDEEGRGMELAPLHRLVDSLAPPATLTWHYRHLTQTLRRLDSLDIGAVIPEFEYADGSGRIVRFDSVARTLHRVVLVGATWCRPCDEAQRMLASAAPRLKVLRIDLDHHPKGWNATYIEQLAVEHIPYIILLDEQGRIAARDLRAWQVPDFVR